jgi:hypothetical protein
MLTSKNIYLVTIDTYPCAAINGKLPTIFSFNLFPLYRIWFYDTFDQFCYICQKQKKIHLQILLSRLTKVPNQPQIHCKR